jgi:hypothetical protein
MKMSRHIGFPPPHVAAAIDLDSDDQFEADEFILLTNNGLEWSGTIDIKDAPIGNLFVKTAFMATVGARLTIRVRRNDKNGAVMGLVDFITKEPTDVVYLSLTEPT